MSFALTHLVGFGGVPADSPTTVYYSPWAVSWSGTKTASNEEVSSPSQASWRHQPDGDVEKGLQASYSTNHTWGSGPAGLGAAHELRVTKNSGTTPSGITMNTWTSLEFTRTVNITHSGGDGTTTCNLTYEIRDATSLDVLDSGTYVITAIVNSA
jgi:hypothetical protein